MTSTAPKTPRPANSKILTPAVLSRLLRLAQAQGQRVVFTNGCFDLLHAGHVKVLERARRCGDLLVVGLNSDRSTRALKGPDRPIVPERSRAQLLAALECVDYVSIFDAPTPYRLIAMLRPDVLIKGADWSAQQIVGSDLVKRYGGRIVRIPLLKGYSTTKILEQIRRRR